MCSSILTVIYQARPKLPYKMPRRISELATTTEFKDVFILAFKWKKAVARNSFFEHPDGLSVRKCLDLPDNHAVINDIRIRLGSKTGAPRAARIANGLWQADAHFGHKVAGATQADYEYYRKDATLIRQYLFRQCRAARRPFQKMKAKAARVAKTQWVKKEEDTGNNLIIV